MRVRGAILQSVLLSAAALCARAAQTILSNTALPLDSSGALMQTGESCVLAEGDGSYVLYANVWGGCPGVDCCPSSGGCASCCFAGPNDPCVYTSNHTVVAYRTRDFAAWAPLGAVQTPADRRTGTEFRPQVVYSPARREYVLWYEDRWASGGSNPGYAVATAPTAAGPFTTLSNSTVLPGKGRVGDYDLFVDPDTGKAYHVRTGVTIVELSADYTAPASPPAVYELPDGSVEGPAMFKRAGVYYLLFGVGCCACRGGSNVLVYTAPAPLGPYTFRGDVGSNKTSGHVFDKASPWNYVTRSQQTKVFTVPASDGSLQYVFLGNQWVTAQQPGRPRSHDLLFWAVLQFDAAGMIQQLTWQDSATIDV